MAIDLKVRTIQKTISSSNADLVTAATAQDAAVLAYQNTLIAAPPTGIVGTVLVGPLTVIFDSTDFDLVQTVTYNTQLPA